MQLCLKPFPKLYKYFVHKRYKYINNYIYIYTKIKINSTALSVYTVLIHIYIFCMKMYFKSCAHCMCTQNVA